MGKPRDSTQLRVVESRGYEESGRLGKKWCRGREKRSLDLRGGWSRLIRSITQAPDPERTYFLRRPPESARGFDFLAVALLTAFRTQAGSVFAFTGLLLVILLPQKVANFLRAFATRLPNDSLLLVRSLLLLVLVGHGDTSCRKLYHL